MIHRMIAAVLTGVIAVIAGTPCPEVTAQPVEDGSLIRIRHNQPQPLTAFLVEIVDYPGNRFAYMQDELLRTSIAAGKERRIVVNNLMPGTVPDYLRVTAAIYADGASCGSADTVKLIVDARRQNLQLTREVISRIEKALSAGDSIENLSTELSTWARSASSPSSGVLMHVADQLRRTSPNEVLSALRVVEQTFVASKPRL